MKILAVNKINAHRIYTDDEPWGDYTRYGADCWFLSMGESEEPVYYYEELENEYQIYKDLNERIIVEKK